MTKEVIKELVEKLSLYDKHFHEIGEPLVSDLEYDIIKDELYELDPNNKYFKKIGNVCATDKTKLPYYMGSLDKIKDDNEKGLNNWINKYKGEYNISDKLDGISALLIKKDGNLKLFTRGDGTFGRDVSEILQYIQYVPDNLEENDALRGELIISKISWNKNWGSNARNTVAGLVNSKTLNKNILKYVDFVIYELVYPRYRVNDSFKKMNKYNNIKIVHNQNKSELKTNELTKLLDKRKHESEYEIDGIVISDCSKTYNIKDKENPKYAIAFKSMTTLDEALVIVKDIEWNVSKDGYLKPTVVFDPVLLDSVFIKAATGFNAAFIRDNMINKGSKIIIIRSGGVIPKIQKIITKSLEPLFPSNIKWKWNKTNIDIVIDVSDDESNDDQNIKSTLHFVKTLELKNIAEGTIKKLYNAGHKKIKDIIKLNKDDLLKIDGIQSKLADNILSSLEEIKNKKLHEIMAASNMFGRGLAKKKLETVIEKFPDILTKDVSVDDIQTIDGIGKVSSKSFIDNLGRFKEFYKYIPKNDNISKNKKVKNIVSKEVASVKLQSGKNMEGIHVLFTGVRDKSLEEMIIENRGIIESNFNKKVNLVVRKDEKTESGSVKKALKNNIELITIDEFRKRYT